MTFSQVRRRALAGVVALAVSAALTNLARAADATLLTAADGQAFSIGSTPYRVVTAARAVAGAQGSLAPRSPAVRDSMVVGRIGDYAIVLGAPGGGSVARTASSPEYLVAVNQRSGGPALVARRLKLFRVSADQAALAASRTGGAVEAFVPASSMAILQYATPAAALVAMETIRGSSSGAAVQPEVIQAFRKGR